MELKGKKLYVDPWSKARAQVGDWRNHRPLEASLLQKIASQPQSIWLTDDRAFSLLDAHETSIGGSGLVPSFVVYNLPQRDISGYSGGGATSLIDYKRWIKRVAERLQSWDW